MNNRFRVFGLSVILFFSFTFFAIMTAQAEYPEKPIKLIVAVGPGGSIDRMSRALASFWHETLGQPVIVENRKGGGGLVAWRRALKAKPDGYTVIAHMFPMVNTMLIRHKPNFGLDDMAFINVQWSDPHIILAQKSTGWKNINDMIAAIKKSPNKYSHATASEFSAAPQLFKMLGLKVKMVPYGGGGSARAAVMGGHTTMTTSGARGALGVKKAVVGLGVSWPKEVKGWEGVRPINEQVKNLNFPNMASLRFFAVPAAMKKKYPERFKKLVSSYQELITKNKGFKKFLKRSKIGAEWIGPEKTEKIAREVQAFAERVLGKKKK